MILVINVKVTFYTPVYALNASSTTDIHILQYHLLWFVDDSESSRPLCNQSKDKGNIRNQYNQVPHQDIRLESDKTQESVIYNRSSALSQQVITRLLETDKTVCQRLPQI